MGDRLKGEVAFVTGAAARGNGSCRRLETRQGRGGCGGERQVRHSEKRLVQGRELVEGLDEVVAEIGAIGTKALAVVAGVEDPRRWMPRSSRPRRVRQDRHPFALSHICEAVSVPVVEGDAAERRRISR